jgi:hypothetical protein
MDIGNFTRYMILHIWAQNHDWPNSNVLAARPRRPDGKWIFLTWDAEAGLGAMPRGFDADTLEHIYTRSRYPVSQIFISLMKNLRFQQRFREEFERQLAGTLSPANVIPSLQRLSELIEPDMSNEIRLWQGEIDIDRWHENIRLMEVFAWSRERVIREKILNSPRFSE